MKDNIYSVSQVNHYVNLLLEDDVLLNGIYIEGEVSNLKKHTSGHLYFTLKDTECSINCIMYRQNATMLEIDMQNSLNVVCFGYISSYPKTGQYQLYVKTIDVSGIGNISLAFEKLKEKLNKEGLFDPVYKMEIPKLPKNIGVITSPTGAAIRDILNISNRRNPNVKIIVIPALVQGDFAPDSIIDAISLANEYRDLDIIILARGGGSKEDLWAFNDENLARAIFYSAIPIVTGIGHEIDFTIADFVADFRAPTPSAAIEICLPEVNTIKEQIFNNYQSLNNNIKKIINEKKLIYKFNIEKSYFYKFPNKILEYKLFVENSVENINKEILVKIKENKFLLQSHIDKIEALSPVNILRSGYSLVSKDNENIKSVNQLKKDDEINITFSDGNIKAKIIE